MYQSQVRPGSTGRKLVAQQQSEQHPSKQQNPSSRFYRNDIVLAALEPFRSISERARTTVRLILMTGFLAAITGCGGLNYNKLGTAPGSSQGNAVALSEISCGTQSLTGPQSKTCSASLSAAALTTTTVKLSSSSTTLQIPSAVTIAVGQTSATFAAVTAGVSKTVSVTITGVSRGVTKTNVITLYPTPTATLTKVSCAVQSLTGPTATACSVYLSAAATSPIVVSLSSNTSALKVPPTVTIPSGANSASFNATASEVSSTQSASLTAAFGGISQSYSIQLVGSNGQMAQQHKVQLSWNAPTSSAESIVGYNVYRAIAGDSSYALLTSSLDTQTSYTDAVVTSGSTYNYVVTSVDSTGMESKPSNSTLVTIP